jgi:hypothetical protein
MFIPSRHQFRFPAVLLVLRDGLIRVTQSNGNWKLYVYFYYALQNSWMGAAAWVVTGSSVKLDWHSLGQFRTECCRMLSNTNCAG